MCTKVYFCNDAMFFILFYKKLSPLLITWIVENNFLSSFFFIDYAQLFHKQVMCYLATNFMRQVLAVVNTLLHIPSAFHLWIYNLAVNNDLPQIGLKNVTVYLAAQGNVCYQKDGYSQSPKWEQVGEWVGPKGLQLVVVQISVGEGKQ